MPRQDPQGVKSLLRALSLLEILGSSPAERALGDIAHAAKMPPSTTHRLLHTLQLKGYVAQNSLTSDYALGESLILLGRKAESQRDVRVIARPWLEKLALETRETVNLTTVVEHSVVQLDHIDSPNILKVTWADGQRFPIHASASGKVFLAFLSTPDRERILQGVSLEAFTKSTIVDGNRSRHELQTIRQRGYALDDAEREEGVRCVAAPIFDAQGEVTAAVSLTGPSLRLSLPRLYELAGTIVATAQAISAALGYRCDHHGRDEAH